MTADVDVDGIMKAMSDPQVGKNSADVLGVIREVNIVLKEVQTTVGFLDSMGLKPLIVRIAGKKYGVDAETPLSTEGFKAATPTHKKAYEYMNQLEPSVIEQMFTQGENNATDE